MPAPWALTLAESRPLAKAILLIILVLVLIRCLFEVFVQIDD